MEIVDVLVLPLSKSPYFTVNVLTPVNNAVPIVNPLLSPPVFSTVVNTAGNEVFVPGDNFSIQSVGYSLPENFVMSRTAMGSLKKAPSLFIALVLSNGTRIDHPIYGGNGVVIPMENYENVINSFLDLTALPGGLTQSFKLIATLLGDTTTPVPPQVSMIGVPASLNGTVQNITVFLKVLHNSALRLNF